MEFALEHDADLRSILCATARRAEVFEQGRNKVLTQILQKNLASGEKLKQQQDSFSKEFEGSSRREEEVWQEVLFAFAPLGFCG